MRPTCVRARVLDHVPARALTAVGVAAQTGDERLRWGVQLARSGGVERALLPQALVLAVVVAAAVVAAAAPVITPVHTIQKQRVPKQPLCRGGQLPQLVGVRAGGDALAPPHERARAAQAMAGASAHTT